VDWVLPQADGIVSAAWEEAAQSDWVVFLVLAAGQTLISGCAEQSPPPAAVSPLHSAQEPRCGSTGFLVSVPRVGNCLSCQRLGDFWATRLAVEWGENGGCSERNFEIDVAGFFEKDFEEAAEGGFVEQMAVWQEEVGEFGAVGEEQEQT